MSNEGGSSKFDVEHKEESSNSRIKPISSDVKSPTACVSSTPSPTIKHNSSNINVIPSTSTAASTIQHTKPPIVQRKSPTVVRFQNPEVTAYHAATTQPHSVPSHVKKIRSDAHLHRQNSGQLHQGFNSMFPLGGERWADTYSHIVLTRT